MNTGKVVLSVLVGIAAGAALGALFAPDKGTNTRKKISKAGDNYIEEMEEKFNDLLEKFNDKYETAKERADDLTDKAKLKVHDVKKDLKTT